MTQPALQVGQTHDVVIHVNASVAVGLTVMPSTYRIRNAPTFLPRFSTGDPLGMDKGRWKSWVQSDFSGGAGQVRYSETRANNRYAESSMMDPGMIGDLKGIKLAVLPVRLSSESQKTRTLFTNAHRVFAQEHSLRPVIMHNRMTAIFTNVVAHTLGDPFGGFRGHVFNRPPGQWAVVETGIMAQATVSVTKFSSVIHRADGLGITAYSNLSRYTPSYNTLATNLEVYDSKLWRAEGGRSAAYDPITALWTTFYYPGDPDVPIKQMEPAFGRLYWGKEDSLWVFDAGRVYEVQSFKDYRDPENFNVLIYHRGELYWNIRNILYRLTGALGIEIVDVPLFPGVYKDAASSGNELILTLQEQSGRVRYIIYDSDTRGWHRWLDGDDLSLTDVWEQLRGTDQNPTSVATAFGYLFLGPTNWRDPWGAVTDSLDFPIAMVNRLTPAEYLKEPNYARGLGPTLSDRAYFITSLVDQGLPEIDKLYNRVLITLLKTGTDVNVAVSALTQVASPELISAGIVYGGTTYLDYTDVWKSGRVRDGVEATENSLGSVLDRLVLGFNVPPDGFVLRQRERPTDIPSFLPPVYWNGTAWKYLPQTADGTDRLKRSGTMHLFPEKTKWVKGITSSPATSGVPAYWFAALFPSAFPRAVYEVTPIGSLFNQEWLRLHEDTVLPYPGTSAGPTYQIAAPFPINTIGREVAVLVEVDGGEMGNALIQKIEVEYLELQQPLDIIDFTAVATDPIQLLNGVQENSGAHIVASLFSMSKSGLLYTAQVPYPPPVGHTSTYRIMVTDPGAVIPVLAYRNTMVGGMIPVRLDEMRTETRAGWGNLSAPTGF